MMTTRAMTGIGGLAVLHRDSFQNVGHVFAAVRGRFEELVNFFLFDQCNGVMLGGKQISNRFPHAILDFKFAPLNPVALLRELIGLLYALAVERLQRLNRGPNALMNQAGNLRHPVRRALQSMASQRYAAAS